MNPVPVPVPLHHITSCCASVTRLLRRVLVCSQKKYSKPILLHEADLSDAAKRKANTDQWKRTFDINTTAEKKFAIILDHDDVPAEESERDEAEQTNDKSGDFSLAELLKTALAGKQGCALPMLMSAAGEPLPLSELACSAGETPAQVPLAEPEGTPPKKLPKRKKAAAGKENKEPAKKPAPAKKARKPSKKAETEEEEEATAPPPPPPVLPSATVRRTDGAGRTELRKAADADSEGNGVIVFDDDVVAVAHAGDEFSYVQAGRKKGFIQSAYLVHA